MSKRDLNSNSCGQFGKLKSDKAATRFSVAIASNDQYPRVRRRARKPSTEKTEKRTKSAAGNEETEKPTGTLYVCVCVVK